VNLHVPTEYGGAGLHALDGVVVGEELAYGCTGMMTAMEGNGLASAPVIIAGSDAQKVRAGGCCAGGSPSSGGRGAELDRAAAICGPLMSSSGTSALFSRQSSPHLSRRA
jgi:alkylation response protein AidB-like acyl-CoA dehydrogenase